MNVQAEAGLVLRVRCNAAAPLVVNGSSFIGCRLDKDHEGEHEVIVRWGR